MSNLFVDNIKHQSSQGSGTITLGASGETVALASGASQTMAVNTPYFEARRSGTQTITNDTNTKIACDVETWDTAGDYDNATNYRFTPQTAGKYFIYGQATAQADIQQLKRFSLFIRKNGSDVKYMSNYFTNNEAYINTIYLSTIIDFNGSSDYVELWCKLEYASSGTLVIDGGTPGPTFGGYKIIE